MHSATIKIEGHYLHFHRMYKFIAEHMALGNLKHFGYLTVEDDCTNDI